MDTVKKNNEVFSMFWIKSKTFESSSKICQLGFKPHLALKHSVSDLYSIDSSPDSAKNLNPDSDPEDP